MIEKYKILLIEDCPKDTELAVLKLITKFDVVTVDTLQAGLTQLESDVKFHCVILDLQLKNGLKESVYQDVRKKYKDGPIGVVTGDTDPRTRDYIMLQRPGFFAVKGQEDGEKDLVSMIHQAIQLWGKQKGKHSA